LEEEKINDGASTLKVRESVEGLENALKN